MTNLDGTLKSIDITSIGRTDAESFKIVLSNLNDCSRKAMGRAGGYVQWGPET